MIRARRHPWPIPTDTALDRSRTIARSLLTALQASEREVIRLRDALGDTSPPPTAAAEHMALAERFGEMWLAPALDTTSDERRLTTEEAAALVGRTPGAIRQWVSRGTRHGQLTRHPDGIDERELLELAAAMRNHPTEGTRP